MKKGPYPLGPCIIGDSVGDQILNMFDKESQQTLRRVADDYGELADPYIPTGVSALESADSALESADSSANSAKVSVWVRGLKIYNEVLVSNKD